MYPVGRERIALGGFIITHGDLSFTDHPTIRLHFISDNPTLSHIIQYKTPPMRGRLLLLLRMAGELSYILHQAIAIRCSRANISAGNQLDVCLICRVKHGKLVSVGIRTQAEIGDSNRK